MGCPSTINLVPNEEVAYCELGEPASRNVITLALPKDGIFVIPPGNNANKSVNEDGCKCSIAVCPIMVVLVIPFFSEAVTTTSFIALLPVYIRIYKGFTRGTCIMVSTS